MTSEPGRAAELLAAALERLGVGSVGACQAVWLDRFARRPTYVHDQVLIRIRRTTDAVVIDQGGHA